MVGKIPTRIHHRRRDLTERPKARATSLFPMNTSIGSGSVAGPLHKASREGCEQGRRPLLSSAGTDGSQESGRNEKLAAGSRRPPRPSLAVPIPPRRVPERATARSAAFGIPAWLAILPPRPPPGATAQTLALFPGRERLAEIVPGCSSLVLIHVGPPQPTLDGSGSKRKSVSECLNTSLNAAAS